MCNGYYSCKCTRTAYHAYIQVPQFIVFDEVESGKMVACTQPRRLAASGVATRVAAEMDVKLGQYSQQEY
jgi:hypothetical protein